MNISIKTQPITRHFPPHNTGRKESFSVIPLIQKLCITLAKENIAYCHWKSNDVIEYSASGDNDLDLLVSRADVRHFSEILYKLGFKRAMAPALKQMPGVLDYFGYDEEADKIIHVHAHYQLILGHDMTKNYRLPIEKLYLESAVQGDLFKLPSAEFEFIVYVIRMVLKHTTWDAILGREGTLKTVELNELAYLQIRTNRDHVDKILIEHLPYINVELFDKCLHALKPDCSAWTRMRTGHELQLKLHVFARSPIFIDAYLKLVRRAVLVIRRRIFKYAKYASKYRLECGGAMIAVVGGDGSGKSTAVDALHSWLSKNFETMTVHLGKPDWSWTTITIRSILKIGNLIGLYPVESSFLKTLNQKSLVSPGYPWLLREVCRARDRYMIYRKARRFTAKGGLVICDRFPLPQIKLMDGPQSNRFINQLMVGPRAELFMSPHNANRLSKILVKLEASYYQQIVLPELLIVLRVNPEIAVQRRTDENANFVRERSSEIWEQDWEHTDFHIIDGSKSKKDVLSELKTLMWSRL